jgi:hypothetical protein
MVTLVFQSTVVSFASQPYGLTNNFRSCNCGDLSSIRMEDNVCGSLGFAEPVQAEQGAFRLQGPLLFLQRALRAHIACRMMHRMFLDGFASLRARH